MALIITVTKKSVVERQSKLFSIILHMTALDGAATVIDTDYSKEYRTGDDVSLLYQSFLDTMQADIDKYKREKAIYTHAKMDQLVTALNNNLVG